MAAPGQTRSGRNIAGFVGGTLVSGANFRFGSGRGGGGYMKGPVLVCDFPQPVAQKSGPCEKTAFAKGRSGEDKIWTQNRRLHGWALCLVREVQVGGGGYLGGAGVPRGVSYLGGQIADGRPKIRV